jgi:hypothetical protein
MGYDGTRTFNGPGGGTVTVKYGGLPGVLAGQWSETYSDYSDNGVDFVNGTVAVNGTAVAGAYNSHLTMTGSHNGRNDIEFNSVGEVHGESTLDGNTVSGPTKEQAAKGACPGMLPKEPALEARSKRIKRGVYRVRVTSSIAGVGANESGIDIQPVYHATLKLGNTVTHTDANGTAKVTVRRTRDLRVTAGDTLKPTAIRLGPPALRCKKRSKKRK